MIPTAIRRPESGPGVAVAAPAPPASVHIALAGCSLIIFVFCCAAAPIGAWRSSIPSIETALLLVVPLMIPAAFCHERKSWTHRDSMLMIPWALVIALLIMQAACIATTHAAYPLRDPMWRRFDEHLGIRIPDLMAFVGRHPFLAWLSRFSYAWLLHPLTLAAIFLPALLGKKQAAQRFILSNAIAFVVALPCMLLLPGVGPWVGWHFEPTPLQQACEASIVSLRSGMISRGNSFGGIICFPSFHVFWALVSANALQPFRFLRYPAILAAGLITVSTMTTGWHYGIDVIGGVVLAVFSTALASQIAAADRSLSLKRLRSMYLEMNRFPRLNRDRGRP